MSDPFDRREFLKIGAATCAGTAVVYGAMIDSPLKKMLFQKIKATFVQSDSFPMELFGPNHKIGHRMRELMPDLLRQSATLRQNASKKKVLVLGGGIAGLSAGWWLKRNHFDDFSILELEENVGGNSVSGQSVMTEFPWGAHYLPLPNSESTEVKMLLEEMGLIQSYDSKSKPLFLEQHLVADPEERLYKDGVWQEGLVPKIGLTREESAEIDRFLELMESYRSALGSDGKPAFAIPVAYSSTDRQYTDLDLISFDTFLKKHQFSGKPLLWFLNYSTRDDYGARIEKVSAWAGIHYFAARRGVAGNAGDHEVLTWPEGNGFIVKYLKTKLLDQISSQQFVGKVEKLHGEYFVYHYDLKSSVWKCTRADEIICSMPQHILKYLLADLEEPNFSTYYSPWLVANIGLREIPQGKGFQAAWDNVSYHSEALGYITATHQNLKMKTTDTVITYYLPLDQEEPKVVREKLLKSKVQDFAPSILSDLEKMHSGITQDVSFLKVWLWGHGMITPIPNYVWNQERLKWKKNVWEKYPGMYFAHSDQTGISIFEEAQYHGIQAAREILKEKLRKNS
ncbi:MAG: NAD(P)-binding protein [Pseudobdellovibrionaceae bacterium]